MRIVSRNGERAMGRSGSWRFLPVIGAVVTIGAALTPLSARADVIFNNFNVDNGFTYNTGVPIDGANTGYYETYQAASFTPLTNCTIDKVELGFRHLSGEDVYNIQIVSDSNGLPSSSAFASGNFSAPVTPGIATWNLGSSTASLAANTKYWVVIMPHGGTTLGSWQANSIGQTGGYAQRTLPQFFGWSAQSGATPTFRVSGTATPAAVPEPGTLALLLLPATLGIALFHRTKTT